MNAELIETWDLFLVTIMMFVVPRWSLAEGQTCMAFGLNDAARLFLRVKIGRRTTEVRPGKKDHALSKHSMKEQRQIVLVSRTCNLS